MRLFIILLLIFLTFSIVCNAESFIGRWGWMQYASASNGKISLCVGDLIVKKDKTFWIWNVCKINDSNHYIEAEAEGIWKRISKNIYKAYYGCYYYDIFIKDGYGIFTSMSLCDELDSNTMEFGVMFKHINIKNLRKYYNSLGK